MIVVLGGLLCIEIEYSLFISLLKNTKLIINQDFKYRIKQKFKTRQDNIILWKLVDPTTLNLI
jgi:hypothetical protein